MVQKLNRLSARAVRNLKPGTFADGGNLFIRVAESGSSSWIFRYKSMNKVRQLGLGSSRNVSLAEARKTAAELRVKIARGEPLDSPLARRKSIRAQPTFKECALAFIEGKSAEWKNKKHKQQWVNTLEMYVFPVVGGFEVNKVGLDDVKRVLDGIWHEKTETASRIRARIENILDYAYVRGFRGPENPARWRGNLDKLLPAASKIAKVKNFEAIDYRELPDLMTKLASDTGQGSKCLQMLIYTAVRSGEVRKAEWSDIDLNQALWTIPAEKMKNGKIHRVPLSKPCLSLLRSLPVLPNTDLIFHSDRNGVLSDVAVSKALRKYVSGPTVHGMRSSFRQWCAEQTSHPETVCELALAHTPQDKLQATYQRSDLYDRRVGLMQEWGAFLLREVD